MKSSDEPRRAGKDSMSEENRRDNDAVEASVSTSLLGAARKEETMYYEEKIINGILHWRGNPNDDFKPFTLQELSSRWLEQRNTENHLRAAIKTAEDALRPFGA